MRRAVWTKRILDAARDFEIFARRPVHGNDPRVRSRAERVPRVGVQGPRSISRKLKYTGGHSDAPETSPETLAMVLGQERQIRARRTSKAKPEPFRST